MAFTGCNRLVYRGENGGDLMQFISYLFKSLIVAVISFFVSKKLGVL